MMGSYIILYISTLLPVWELATGCDVTGGTDSCGLVAVVREFLLMKKKNDIYALATLDKLLSDIFELTQFFFWDI